MINPTAISELHRVYYAHHRETCPNVPHFAIPKPAYKLTDTNGLTRAVVDFLNWSGHQAERINTMGRQIKAKSGRQIWIKTTGSKGSADVSCTILGRSVKIEVKNAATHDRIRPKQEQYAARVRAAGGQYWIVRDFEGFYQQYIQFITNKH